MLNGEFQLRGAVVLMGEAKTAPRTPLTSNSSQMVPSLVKAPPITQRPDPRSLAKMTETDSLGDVAVSALEKHKKPAAVRSLEMDPRFGHDVAVSL